MAEIGSNRPVAQCVHPQWVNHGFNFKCSRARPPGFWLVRCNQPVQAHCSTGADLTEIEVGNSKPTTPGQAHPFTTPSQQSPPSPEYSTKHRRGRQGNKQTSSLHASSQQRQFNTTPHIPKTLPPPPQLSASLTNPSNPSVSTYQQSSQPPSSSTTIHGTHTTPQLSRQPSPQLSPQPPLQPPAQQLQPSPVPPLRPSTQPSTQPSAQPSRLPLLQPPQITAAIMRCRTFTDLRRCFKRHRKVADPLNVISFMERLTKVPLPRVPGPPHAWHPSLLHMVEQLLRCFHGHIDSYSSRELVNCVWVLAKLRVHAPPELLSDMLVRLLQLDDDSPPMTWHDYNSSLMTFHGTSLSLSSGSALKQMTPRNYKETSTSFSSTPSGSGSGAMLGSDVCSTSTTTTTDSNMPPGQATDAAHQHPPHPPHPPPDDSGPATGCVCRAA